MHTKTRLLTLTSLFAGMIFLATAYLLHIPTGVGYIHLGDTFIYLAACLLPLPYAIVAAVVGAGLADVVSGMAVWFLPTIIIKSLMVSVFFKKSDNIFSKTNVMFVVIASFIGLFGYVIAEVILYGDIHAAIISLPTGSLQPIGSFICFLMLSKALDSINVKKRVKV